MPQNFLKLAAKRTYTGKETETVQEFIWLMREPKYTASDTAISYRTINHWSSIGLLSESGGLKAFKLDKWRKFDLNDLILIAIYKKLRNFGMELDKLKLTKKSLLTENDTDWPLLSFWTTQLMLGWQSPIVVFEDGSADIMLPPDLAEHYGLDSPNSSYIVLNQAEIISEAFPALHDYNKKIHQAKSPSKEAKKNKILKALEDRNIKQLLIKLEDGEPISLEKTFTFKTDEKRKKINYGQIIQKAEHGKIVSTEITSKEKL